MSGELTIRPARDEDAGALAGLMAALGYPTEPAAMRRRLSRIADDPEYATFVAEDGEVVGMVGVRLGFAYNHDAPYARILALVVVEAARGRGAGTALVRAAEAWARSKAAASVQLTTALHRDGAHAFYQRMGFAATGTRFVKPLPPPWFEGR